MSGARVLFSVFLAIIFLLKAAVRRTRAVLSFACTTGVPLTPIHPSALYPIVCICLFAQSNDGTLAQEYYLRQPEPQETSATPGGEREAPPANLAAAGERD